MNTPTKTYDKNEQHLRKRRIGGNECTKCCKKVQKNLRCLYGLCASCCTAEIKYCEVHTNFGREGEDINAVLAAYREDVYQTQKIKKFIFKRSRDATDEILDEACNRYKKRCKWLNDIFDGKTIDTCKQETQVIEEEINTLIDKILNPMTPSINNKDNDDVESDIKCIENINNPDPNPNPNPNPIKKLIKVIDDVKKVNISKDDISNIEKSLKHKRIKNL